MSVIPVKYADKKPAVKWRAFQERAADLGQLRVWFGNGARRNVGIVTGYGGLTVIDFDDPQAYANWLHWCQHEAAELTYRVWTARGVHVYIRLPQPTRTRPLREHHIDIKSRGGYVLAPPSVHPSGVVYRAPWPHAPIISVPTLSTVLPAAILATAVRSKSVYPKPNKKSWPEVRDVWNVVEQSSIVTEDLVERIKAVYRIEDLLPFRQPGRDGFEMARCPFHDDQHPSMWVNTELQICGCFAGCTDKPLDVINLYARLNDLTNREAIVTLGRELEQREGS